MLQRAADILNAGKKTVILAGRGALGASAELLAVAERLRRRSSSRCSARRPSPTTAPITTGGIGLLGTKPSQEALESCDTLLIVGSTFPYIEFYPKPGRRAAVQIDLDPQRIGLRYPVEVGLVGDSSASCRAAAAAASKNDRSVPREARRRACSDGAS